MGKGGVVDVESASRDEVALAEMFAEVFSLPTATVDDDFFSLGDDSLTATLLLTAIGAVAPAKWKYHS